MPRPLHGTHCDEDTLPVPATRLAFAWVAAQVPHCSPAYPGAHEHTSLLRGLRPSRNTPSARAKAPWPLQVDDVQFPLAGSKACVAGHLLVQDPACSQKGGSQPGWQLHVPFPPSKTPWPLHVVAFRMASFKLVAHAADASI